MRSLLHCQLSTPQSKREMPLVFFAPPKKILYLPALIRRLIQRQQSHRRHFAVWHNLRRNPLAHAVRPEQIKLLLAAQQQPVTSLDQPCRPRILFVLQPNLHS